MDLSKGLLKESEYYIIYSKSANNYILLIIKGLNILKFQSKI